MFTYVPFWAGMMTAAVICWFLYIYCAGGVVEDVCGDVFAVVF
jgi:hypothetical protein